MNLLITGAWAEAKLYIPELEVAGHNVVFMQQEADALPCDPSRIEGVVCNGLFLHHDIKDFTDLSYIQLTSAGLDRVPVDYIRRHNIELHNARGVYSVPMAEHAVAAVLNVFRNSWSFFENRSKRVWLKDRNLRELYGSKVCIIGCGSVGSECAKRFSAFGCDVTGVDIKPFESTVFQRICGIGDILCVIPEADVIVLTVPLTEQTEGLVDKEFLNRLKPGCVIVNISRGKVISTDALIDSLSGGELYAALDVFEEEPLAQDSPLWDMKNVLITPHNSFVGDGNARRLSKCIMDKLKNHRGFCK